MPKLCAQVTEMITNAGNKSSAAQGSFRNKRKKLCTKNEFFLIAEERIV